MEPETKLKMYTVITLDENKTILRYVQLTRCQFGKYFSKDVINFFLHQRTLQLPKTGKIGRIHIIKLTIGLTECLVVNLSSRSFTNRFSGGDFKVITKYIEPSDGSYKNVSVIEPQPETVVTELSSINVLEPNTQSEKTDTSHKTKRKSTKTKVIEFPSYLVFSFDYSLVIRLNPRNLSTFYILSDVG
jgi:hypothetical protein